MQNLAPTSELDSPVWAVVTMSDVLCTGLDYHNAEGVAWIFQRQGNQGVAIATADAASRMRKKSYAEEVAPVPR